MVSHPVLPSDIPQVTQYIKASIEILSERYGGPCFDEVYRNLCGGIWTLHSVKDEGFFILDWQDKTLFIVSAFATERVTTKPFFDTLKQLEQYAIKNHCDALEFRSPRRAWRRILNGYGFTFQGETFRKTL